MKRASTCFHSTARVALIILLTANILSGSAVFGQQQAGEETSIPTAQSNPPCIICGDGSGGFDGEGSSIPVVLAPESEVEDPVTLDRITCGELEDRATAQRLYDEVQCGLIRAEIALGSIDACQCGTAPASTTTMTNGTGTAEGGETGTGEEQTAESPAE